MSDTANGHINEDDLELYILGRLDAGKAAKIDIHLIVCKTCQDLYEREKRRIAQIKAGLKKLSDEERGKEN